jgi:hypothetical protein
MCICYVEESRPPLWSSGQSSWLHNGDVLCFLWGTNWMCICYVEESRPPLWPSGRSSWLHNRDVLCFLWGTNWMYLCYVNESRPPLWSSGQSSWLQIQMSGFDSGRYQIFWEVMGLERGQLSLVSTTEELLGKKVAAPVYKAENTAVGIRHADHVAPSIRKKLEITSPTIGVRSVGIVRSRTQATVSYFLIFFFAASPFTCSQNARIL